MIRNIRFYVLLVSVIWSLVVYVWVSTSNTQPLITSYALTRIYALTAVIYLYFALLAGPFCYAFRWFPWRGKYLKARRGIGVSAFYFGWLHGLFAFFGYLGGFSSLLSLSATYLIAITLSFIALVILSLMAATSFDKMIAKLTFAKWKKLHRFVYLAGLFIFIHAILIGEDFQTMEGAIPKIFLVGVTFLLILEIRRFDAFLQKKQNPPLRFVSLFAVVAILVGLALYLVQR